MKHTVRKLLALMMALSLGLIMTGMTALAASAASGAPLKDGDYTVNVQLWHASKDQASMAASCVKETADVTVKNGKATMTVHTQPMSMAGITASMQTMSVKQPNGKMKAADIVEVTDGNPTAFRFEVPSWDEYIVLEVNPKIEIMGNKPMDARLKFNVYGLTIVMVLHDINQALYYSDEILAMKDGNLLAAGAPEEVITKDLIEEVFDVPLELREVDGKPFVLPI